jgi:hypothetical protein
MPGTFELQASRLTLHFVLFAESGLRRRAAEVMSSLWMTNDSTTVEFRQAEVTQGDELLEHAGTLIWAGVIEHLPQVIGG